MGHPPPGHGHGVASWWLGLDGPADRGGVLGAGNPGSLKARPQSSLLQEGLAATSYILAPLHPGLDGLRRLTGLPQHFHGAMNISSERLQVRDVATLLPMS